MLGNVLFKYVGEGKSMPTTYTKGTVYFDANTNTILLAISDSETVPFPDLSGVLERLLTLESAIETINGDVTVKDSIKYQINAILNGVSEDFDTLKEIETWLNEHTSTALAMNNAITENTKEIAALKAKDYSLKWNEC